MDVSRFFQNTKKVGIYVCQDTGYRFYHPFNVAGDDEFYQEIEHFPWYYMDWKWEHGVVNDRMLKDDSVLEIGCAHGGFLRKLKERGVKVEGLEMNSEAREACVREGLAVYPDSIEEFVKGREDSYDAVCSFQVLEHVPQVQEFLTASLSVLKPGGIMIVSVPNNESLVLRDDGILNMPPHHMGLWNMNSLIQLQNHFDMKVDAIYLEPLQPYHVGYANMIAGPAIYKKIQEKLPVPLPFIEEFARRVGYASSTALSEHIIGHSIVVVFKKNA